MAKVNEIVYGIHNTELGSIIIATTAKGLCWLGFMVTKENGAYKGDGYSRMMQFYPEATVEAETKCACTLPTAHATADCGSCFASEAQTPTAKLLALPLDLRGTAFQMQVWDALLDIPWGATRCYGDIANQIGRPKASRAVGTAVGQNPVSILVPCHRVLQKSGQLGNYGWGLTLKESLLRQEGVLV
ncbi:hypothetical protein SARC_02795 [Sphaeroforma arctica JP610]|uniref:Methylated-DNA--protein-cysteine methyltransferase n=1 Tax=Sphaeroforma arctica JP610 TaxID=667725 RepID=A0A0L0G7Y6_9EUKA|nr:hypothetical protein SARC_02795 [Sphaeroforma arctica JP610]KNC85006.1 hypothetical protein SARC_02795 [Sphaeroforma arctica JP610]|eukprot:XP_014158908.1 hypothetical protein SARC_02795 [Sphaeroforma arctica JP610]